MSMAGADGGGVSNRISTPPPISRSLRFVAGAWLLLVAIVNAPALRGFAPATMAVTVVALVAFYVALHLLLVRRPNLPAAAAVVIALAPVGVVVAVGGVGLELGALAFYGLSLVVAAVRGDPGCEVLSITGIVLRRRAHVLCLLFSPLDALERTLWRRLHH